MDYLHFQEGDGEDGDGTESVSSEDNLEKRNELEARLYSVVHHNDLSHSLPHALSERFAVNCSENGEVIVSLNEDVDETERNIIYDKLKLIKSCSQRTDNDSDDREEGEAAEETQKRLNECNEILENISNTVKEYSNTNSDKNKTKNSSLFQGYENRIESSCMLSRSDWKANANMEYISLNKSNKQNPVETKLSEVPHDTPNSEMTFREIMRQVNKVQHSVEDVDNSIRLLENFLTREARKYRKMFNSPDIPKRTCATKLKNMKMVYRKIATLKNKKMRNCNITAGDDSELSNVIVGSSGSNGNSVCDSYDNEIICMNSPSIDASKECIVLDSDSEVIELELDPSGTKQNAHNFDGSNMISSASGDGSNNLICNYENSSKKSCKEPVVITLESSEDEQSELNNENSKLQCKRKKKVSFMDTPKKWTKRMIKFYCKTSQERRRFDCLKLIKDMRKTSSWADWVISKDDLSGKRKYEGRCTKCHEWGHVKSKCKTFVRPCVCYMCGETNHRIGRCPQSVCLFCGQRTRYYTEKCADCILRLSEGQRCEICNGEHWKEICPDLWRCYHLTTKNGPIVIPMGQKVNPRRFCWVCAKEGHFAHECNDPYYSSRDVQSWCFVTDYNAADRLKEEREIILSDSAQAKLNSEAGEAFLQQLCDKTNLRIDFVTGDGLPIIKVFGNAIQWKSIEYEIFKYVGESFKDRGVTVNNEENNYDNYVTINNEENIANRFRSVNGIKRRRRRRPNVRNKNKRLKQNL